MEYMIINGFDTSTIPKCVVTDFGEVEAAKPKVSETATLFGVNGNYRVLDGAYAVSYTHLTLPTILLV